MNKKTYETPYVEDLIIFASGVLMNSAETRNASGQDLDYDGSEETFDSFFGS